MPPRPSYLRRLEDGTELIEYPPIEALGRLPLTGAALRAQGAHLPPPPRDPGKPEGGMPRWTPFRLGLEYGLAVWGLMARLPVFEGCDVSDLWWPDVRLRARLRGAT